MERNKGDEGFEMKREKGEGNHSAGRGKKSGKGEEATVRIRAYMLFKSQNCALSLDPGAFFIQKKGQCCLWIFFEIYVCT